MNRSIAVCGIAFLIVSKILIETPFSLSIFVEKGLRAEMRSSPRGVENLLLRCSLCRDQILELLLLALELSEREIR